MGISLTNLRALLITKELAGLVNHLFSKEEQKQGLQGLIKERSCYKSVEFTVTG